MTQKEFTPYTEALALKELGFDEPCFGYYQKSSVIGDNTILPIIFRDKASNFNDYEYSKLGVPFYSAPTYSQAFRWFREKHNLMFQIFYLRNGNYAVLIHRTTSEYMDLVDQIKPSSGCVDEVVDCYSYEEAELACLIKLIEIVKTK